MLQQTQVATVIPYWNRWMARFPHVEALAEANEQEALALWQGLGYYRRCRMLLAGAKWVVEHGMPRSALDWRKVPGVGAYTAGAIASIGYEEATPVVDGNVERVYSRIQADESIGPALHRAAWRWAEGNVCLPRPGDWNQALMELGATICRPVQPNCADCPLASLCVAKRLGITEALPRKQPKRMMIPLRHLTWVPFVQGFWGVRQIPPGQWWESMWEFPRVDASPEAEEALLLLLGEGWAQDAGTFRHAVTHHRIQMEVALFRAEGSSPLLRWVNTSELEALPMPSPQRTAWRLAQRIL